MATITTINSQDSYGTANYANEKLQFIYYVPNQFYIGKMKNKKQDKQEKGKHLIKNVNKIVISTA